MTYKKVISTLLILAMASTTMIGCSKKDSKEDKTNSNESAVENEIATIDSEPEDDMNHEFIDNPENPKKWRYTDNDGNLMPIDSEKLFFDEDGTYITDDNKRTELVGEALRIKDFDKDTTIKYVGNQYVGNENYGYIVYTYEQYHNNIKVVNGDINVSEQGYTYLINGGLVYSEFKDIDKKDWIDVKDILTELNKESETYKDLNELVYVWSPLIDSVDLCYSLDTSDIMITYVSVEDGSVVAIVNK